MLKSSLAWFRDLYLRIFETELIRRIVENSSYLVSASGFTAALGMVQNVYIARMLTVAEFGLFGAIKTFTNVLNRFTSFRINELVVRYVRLFEERGENKKAAAVFKIAAMLEMGGALAAFSLIWVLAPWGAELFGKDASTAPLWILYGSIVVVNLLYDSATGMLHVFNHFRTIAVVTAIQGVALLVMVLVVYYQGFALVGVLLAYVLGKFIGAVGVMGAALVVAGRRWGWKWWLTPLRELREERRSIFNFALSTNISSTISLVAKDSETLWIAAFLGTKQAGYYSFALMLIGLLQLPVSPLPNTTYPELSREIARKDWKGAGYVLQRGSLLAAAYSLPVILVLVAFGQPLIELVFKSKYLPAYPALVILLVGYTFVNIFYWNRVALLALNRPVFPTIVNFIGMLVKVAGIFVLGERYGYIQFAALLSGYYIFTVGLAAGRAILDIAHQQSVDAVA
ncbi:MAG: oligosaccharide flippase family protein [Anaerolineae bacterium]|nr:oligosaccharide flippase family protein [Anaerolineae bacterium]